MSVIHHVFGGSAMHGVVCPSLSSGVLGGLLGLTLRPARLSLVPTLATSVLGPKLLPPRWSSSQLPSLTLIKKNHRCHKYPITT